MFISLVLFYAMFTQIGEFELSIITKTKHESNLSFLLALYMDILIFNVNNILSQTKFNQQLSSTELEVRLHSYTVIQPTTTNHPS
jgi:hypothetical protein